MKAANFSRFMRKGSFSFFMNMLGMRPIKGTGPKGNKYTPGMYSGNGAAARRLKMSPEEWQAKFRPNTEPKFRPSEVMQREQ